MNLSTEQRPIAPAFHKKPGALLFSKKNNYREHTVK